MKVLSAAGIAIIAIALLGAAGKQTASLHGSVLTFKQILTACPDYSLGSISFALNHSRVIGRTGVGVDEDESGDTSTVTFEKADGSKKGTATIDNRTHSVSAKNMRVERNRQVACILAD